MQLKQIEPYKWEVPRTGAMRVPGIVYSSPRMMEGSPIKGRVNRKNTSPLGKIVNFSFVTCALR